MRQAQVLVFLALLLLVAGVSADCQAAAAGGKETDGMKTFRFGFRHDPMQWALKDRSVAAAQVRTLILKQPQPGDKEILKQEIDKILAQQKEDGSLGENTPGNLIRLSRLGCSPDRPEIRRAVAAMCSQGLKERGRLGSYELMAATWAGWENTEELQRSGRKLAEKVMKLDFWSACPWTGQVQVQGLWAVRDVTDVTPALERGLNVILKCVRNGRGWTVFLDPWGFLDCAGYVDHPIAKQIVVEQLPMILRAQQAGGSWGDMKHFGYGPESNSFVVFRALVKWGLLAELRKRLPLPRDWKITRSIPAPPGDLLTMTWDGNRFWVRDKDANEAIAVSPQDGKVLKRLKLPANVHGIAWFNDSLAVVRTDPKAVLLIDPDNAKIKKEIPVEVWGEVTAVAQLDDRLCVANLEMGGVHFIRGAKVLIKHTQMLGNGTFATDLAAAGETLWHIDGFAPAIVQSAPDKRGQLLDWGDKPFDEHTRGIAWDGKHLWALDNKRKRICAIENTKFQGQTLPKGVTAAQVSTSWPDVLAGLEFPLLKKPVSGRSVVFRNTIRNTLPVTMEIRYTWDVAGGPWAVKPSEGSVKIAPGKTATIRTTATFDPARMAPLPQRHTTILLDGFDISRMSNTFTPPPIARHAVATRLARAPKIDGKIEKGEYAGAKPNRGFMDYQGYGAAEHDTCFRLAYDDKALYIAIVAEEPEPDGLVGPPRKRDDAWVCTEDSIEVFIDATWDRSTYHHVIFGIKNGVQYDAIGGPKYGTYGHAGWDGQWQSAAAIGKDSFQVELAIPFKTLGVPAPKPGDKWGLNVCRNRGQGELYPAGTRYCSAWCMTYKHFHMPSHFGIVTFR